MIKKYLNKFYNKYKKAIADWALKHKEPLTGLGQQDCKRYNIPSAKAFMSTQKKQAKTRYLKHNQHAFFRKRVLALWQRINHLYLFPLDEQLILFHARSVGTDLYDFSMKKTGYQTANSILTNKTTEDHFYPRGWAGYVVIRYIQENQGIDYELLVEIIDVLRQVHITTPKENEKLRKYQTIEAFTTWEDAYIKANIELLQVQINDPIKTIESVLPDYHKYTTS